MYMKLLVSWWHDSDFKYVDLPNCIVLLINREQPTNKHFSLLNYVQDENSASHLTIHSLHSAHSLEPSHPYIVVSGDVR